MRDMCIEEEGFRFDPNTIQQKYCMTMYCTVFRSKQLSFYSTGMVTSSYMLSSQNVKKIKNLMGPNQNSFKQKLSQK